MEVIVDKAKVPHLTKERVVYKKDRVKQKPYRDENNLRALRYERVDRKRDAVNKIVRHYALRIDKMYRQIKWLNDHQNSKVKEMERFNSLIDRIRRLAKLCKEAISAKTARVFPDMSAFREYLQKCREPIDMRAFYL